MPFKNKASIWQSSPMLRLLLALVAGILIYDFWTGNAFINSVTIYFLFSANIALILLCTYFIFKTKVNNKLFDYILLVLVVATGFLCCHFHNAQLHNIDSANKPINSRLSIAVVSASPSTKSKTTKYELIILKSRNDALKELSSAFLYVFKDSNSSQLQLGDTLLLPSNWQRITNAGNPFEMNYVQFCARKNIYYQQFVNAKQIAIYRKSTSKKESFLAKAYAFCDQNINQNIKDSSTKALLQAMLLGNEQDIDPNTRQAYSDTGIIHIISISGAHVALFFVFISWLLNKIKLIKKQWIKYLFSLALIWFYVLLAGAPTPAIRAAIMFSILAIGIISKQQQNPFNFLFSAAFFMLLWQPMWLFSIGFQLSFVAVLSISIFYSPLLSIFPSEESIRFSIKNKFFQKIILFLVQATAVSIAAEILVAPLVAYYFHSFPPLFIIANIIASIAMTLILALGFCLLLFGKIIFVNSLIATIITLSSKAFHAIIFGLQKVNIQAFKTIQLSLLDLAILLMVIISFSIFILLHRKNALWLTFIGLLTFASLSLYRSIIISKQEKIIVYNNSQFAQIELIQANRYKVIRGQERETFATKNAHIGFAVSQNKSASKKDVFIIGNQKILILDSNTNIVANFPIDILIVASTKRYTDAAAIINSFHPKQIVLSNHLKSYQKMEWQKMAKISNSLVYDTKTKGAFVFP